MLPRQNHREKVWTTRCSSDTLILKRVVSQTLKTRACRLIDSFVNLYINIPIVHEIFRSKLSIQRQKCHIC